MYTYTWMIASWGAEGREGGLYELQCSADPGAMHHACFSIPKVLKTLVSTHNISMLAMVLIILLPRFKDGGA